MLLYSYRGKEPSTLPFRIILEDGNTRTSLAELSADELESLGFSGPITKPEFDENTQRIEWADGEYHIIQLSDIEIKNRISQKENEILMQKIKNVDYNLFWTSLINSNFYKKLRAAASQSLPANTLCTELIALFNDAKAGRPNEFAIQQYMNILFFNFEFATEEVEELQDFMNNTNLDVIYTLPDAKYLSSHTYDPESNTIVGPSPFESWVLVNGKWEAPISYPSDGKVYNWNEDLGNWIEV